MDKNSMREMVDYYNYDKGVDFPDEPTVDVPFRAICANVAWCLLDEERFSEYYNKSDYWRDLLANAVQHYCSGGEAERMRRLSEECGPFKDIYIASAVRLKEILSLRLKAIYDKIPCDGAAVFLDYYNDITQILVQILHSEGVLNIAKKNCKARDS